MYSSKYQESLFNSFVGFYISGAADDPIYISSSPTDWIPMSRKKTTVKGWLSFLRMYLTLANQTSAIKAREAFKAFRRQEPIFLKNELKKLPLKKSTHSC